MDNQLIEVDGQQMTVEELVKNYQDAKNAEGKLKKAAKKALLRRRQEQSLKPYQAELIKLQHYMESTGKRMIILFEGRDASGKAAPFAG